ARAPDTARSRRSRGPGPFSTALEAILLLLFLLLAALSAAPAAGADAPDKPRLRTPAERETTRAVPPTPPLLIPGRPFAPDSVHETRGQRAKEHVQRARKLESDGFPDAALVEYQNAAGLDATLPGVFDHIGKIYDAFGIYPRAIHAYSLE